MYQDQNIQDAKKSLLSGDSLEEHKKFTGNFLATKKNFKKTELEGPYNKIPERGENEEVSFRSSMNATGENNKTGESFKKSSQNEDLTLLSKQRKESSQSQSKARVEMTNKASQVQESVNQEASFQGWNAKLSSFFHQILFGILIIVNPLYAFSNSFKLFGLYFSSVAFAIGEAVFIKQTPLILYTHLVLNHFSWIIIAFKKFGFKALSRKTTEYKTENTAEEQLFQNIYLTIIVMIVGILSACLIWILKNNASHLLGTCFTCFSIFGLHIVLASNSKRRLSFYLEATKFQRDDIIAEMRSYNGESEQRIRTLFNEMTQRIGEINDGTNWIAFIRGTWLIHALTFMCVLSWDEKNLLETQGRLDIILVIFLCYSLIEIDLAYFRWKFSKGREKVQTEASELTKQLDAIYTLDPPLYLLNENSEPPGTIGELDLKELKIFQSEELEIFKINESFIQSVFESCKAKLPPKVRINKIRKEMKATVQVWKKSIVNIEGLNKKFFEDVSKAYKEIPKELKSIILEKGPAIIPKMI